MIYFIFLHRLWWHLLCRKDGNPFNTTIIPAPQAAPPVSLAPARAPSSPEEPIWNHVIGPSSSPIILTSGESNKKFLTAKAIAWIAVAGISIVVAFLLCLLLPKWLKAKQRDKIAKEPYFNANKGSTEKLKYDRSTFQRSNQTDTGNSLSLYLFSRKKFLCVLNSFT